MHVDQMSKLSANHFRNLPAIFGLLMVFIFSACGSETGEVSDSGESAEAIETVSDTVVDNYYFTVESIHDFFDLSNIQPYLISAHRGSRYYSGWPENCIESFEYIMSKAPAIIEFDIRISKDSVLFLLHDETLDRTTTGTGKAEHYTIDEILSLNLKDADGNLTDFSPSLLRDALEWGRGRTILKLDIKRNVPFQMVIDEVRATESEHHVIIIVYSVDAARIIHRLAPDLMISLPIRNEDELERFIASGLPANRVLAFTGTRLTNQKVFDRLIEKGIPSIQGTIGNLDRQAMSKGFENILEIYNQGASMIATDYPIELYENLVSQSLIKN